NSIWHIEGCQRLFGCRGFFPIFSGALFAVVPHFICRFGGFGGSLPYGQHCFGGPRTGPATELMVRLLRERSAYEINFLPDTSLLVSAPLLPFFYTLVGDRNAHAPPRMKALVTKISPLSLSIFEAIEKRGALSKGKV